MPEIFVTYEPDLFLMDEKTANGTTGDLLKAIGSSAVCMQSGLREAEVSRCRGASRDPNMTLVRGSTVKSIGKPDVLHHYNQTPTTDVLDAMETFEHPLCWKESLRGSLRCVPPSNSAAFFGSRFRALLPQHQLVEHSPPNRLACPQSRRCALRPRLPRIGKCVPKNRPTGLRRSQSALSSTFRASPVS
jgi:hypothetical protein